VLSHCPWTSPRKMEIKKSRRRKQWGIRYHAGPDSASSLKSWIPVFTGMTTRGKPRGIIPKEIKSENRSTAGGLRKCRVGVKVLHLFLVLQLFARHLV
jgi:hypothetical protein